MTQLRRWRLLAWPIPHTPMPLRRYILNTLTVVSLLLMLAMVGLWVRSYWVCYFTGFISGLLGNLLDSFLNFSTSASSCFIWAASANWTSLPPGLRREMG